MLHVTLEKGTSAPYVCAHKRIKEMEEWHKCVMILFDSLQRQATFCLVMFCSSQLLKRLIHSIIASIKLIDSHLIFKQQLYLEQNLSLSILSI